MQQALAKLHKSPEPSLRIIHAGTYQAARGVHFPTHHHRVWELVYYRVGAPICIMNGEAHAGRPGLAWLTPPGITHAERAVTSYANFYIALEIDGSSPWPAFFDDDRDRSLERVCHQIFIECGRLSHGGSRMLGLLAQQLGCLLSRAAGEQILPRPVQAVVQAERLIEEKHSHPLAIRDVARMVNASPSALRSYFQKVRGCSPREYLGRVRSNRAISYLRGSSLKLEAIAELCGYDSASHLSRCIKALTNRTPGQIRAE